MDIMKALRELMSRAEAETDDTGEEMSPTDDTPTAIDGPDEADQPSEAGEGDSTADEAADDTEAETLPASEVSVAELRDALNVLGAENEALRTRIAELGGDAAMGDDMTDDDDDTDGDTDDEEPYDDESATADIDKQKQEIAALRGDN